MKIIIILLSLVAIVFTNTCGGNCPSNDCDSCPCGTEQKPLDINNWCAQHDWDQQCCQCIVQHESGGNSHAMNENTDGSYDVGLWQINDYNWGVCNSGNIPCDPQENLNCAIDVYNWGEQTWKFWVTCEVCGCCNHN
ncbi:Lysozyme-like domain [Pseudocohnilembus persalinus]|uniref:Lysozyme-like domain n=1 Tax=Pseudocohnilembus persalinus TaxID=266149 RepID=A0A0V0QEK3_PSEPJ|nr:Lysozyme-like domain [Pseudocohnilembus persalinus]|eukprot:KRX00650.1 Lysozyme-like domain [Pseudocohnilembus persalinus]